MADNELQPPIKETLPEDTQSEFEQLWKTYHGKSPRHDQALEKVRNALLDAYDPPIDKNNSGLNWLFNRGLEAADYGSGLIRTSLRGGASTAVGGTTLNQFGQDLKDAVNPFDGKPAPSAAEYSKRDKIPVGPSLSDAPGMSSVYAAKGSQHPAYQPEKGGALDPTARGTMDFTTDALLSPAGLSAIKSGLMRLLGKSESQVLSQLSAREIQDRLKAQIEQASGSKQLLQNAGKMILDPAGTTAEGVGKSYYNSAFPDMEQSAKDVLRKNNVFGTAKSVANQHSNLIDDLSQDVKSKIQNFTDQNPNVSIPVDPIKDNVRENIIDKASQMGKTDPALSAGQQMEQEFQTLPHGSSLNPVEMNGLKQTYQDKARRMGAYDQSLKQAGKATQFADDQLAAKYLGEGYKDTAQGARQGVEDALDAGQKGLGGDVYLKNRDIGALLGSEQSMKDLAESPLVTHTLQHATVPVLGSALGLGGYMHGNTSPGLALAIAASGLVGSSTPAKTGLGLALSKFGEQGANFGRAKLIEDDAEQMRQPSPWTLFSNSVTSQKK